MNLTPDNLQNDCTFSPCRSYRYTWSRSLGQDGPPCLFIMLNPSIADEQIVDPTVRKDIGYATRWGHGRLIICNLFAWCATKPKDMLAASDPIGPDNDRHILREAAHVIDCGGIVIAAWGNDGAHRGRSRIVLAMLAAHGIPLHALKINGNGEPAHPLYLRGDLQPRVLCSRFNDD